MFLIAVLLLFVFIRLLSKKADALAGDDQVASSMKQENDQEKFEKAVKIEVHNLADSYGKRIEMLLRRCHFYDAQHSLILRFISRLKNRHLLSNTAGSKPHKYASLYSYSLCFACLI